eukprot:GEZU01001282.1.p1 GENE.GEZU01001282.1~~GEZU01001282.1.p1  ORF type:complete len:262 (+),score=62.71 GEZU01001282.1:320-1105(+)
MANRRHIRSLSEETTASSLHPVMPRSHFLHQQLKIAPYLGAGFHKYIEEMEHKKAHQQQNNTMRKVSSLYEISAETDMKMSEDGSAAAEPTAATTRRRKTQHHKNNNTKKTSTTDSTPTPQQANALRSRHHSAISAAVTRNEEETFSFVFNIEYKTHPGQCVKIVGNIPQLGNWEPARAPTMTWNDGHMWTIGIMMSREEAERVEYKYIVYENKTLPPRWEGGNNRKLGAFALRLPESYNNYFTAHFYRCDLINLIDSWQQ